MTVLKEALDRVRAAYGMCQEYYDAGMGRVSTHLTVFEQFFATSFQRGRGLAMTVQRRNYPVDDEHATHTIAVEWTGPNARCLYGFRGKFEAVSSPDTLIARSAGVCSGLTTWVLPLLVPGITTDDVLQSLVQPSVSDARIGATGCLLIYDPPTERRKSSLRMWIDAQSSFIRRIVLAPEDGCAGLTLEASFDCNCKPMGPT